MRCHPSGSAIVDHLAHVDADASIGRGRRSAVIVDQSRAGVGAGSAAARWWPSRAASAWAKQRMPLPLISARRPSALYSTIARVVAVAPALPTSRPSAPMPRRRSHSRRASAAHGRSTCGSKHDEEVVAEAVVLGEGQLAGHRRRQVARRAPAAPRRPGRASTSTQRMRGSRRNHRSWRTANWRVRATIVADGVVERARRRRGGRAAPCSRAPGGRCATAGRAVASAAHLVEQPGVDHRCTRRSMRSASSGRGQRRPICVNATSAGTTSMPGPNELNGRPLPTLTSRARTMRRPFVGLDPRRRRPGRASASSACSAAPPSSARRASSSARTSGHWPGTSSRIGDGAQVQPGAGDEHGAPRRARRCRPSAAPAASVKLGDGEVVGRIDEVEAVVRRPRPDRRPSAWPCRCPSAGTPASRRRRRSRRSRSAARQRHRHVALARRGRAERRRHDGVDADQPASDRRCAACAAARRRRSTNRPIEVVRRGAR